MATLWVAEFVAIGGTGNFPTPAVQMPPVAEQTVTIGATTTPCTNPFAAATTLIRVHTDVVCNIVVGVTPIATTGNLAMAANSTEYLSIPPGLNYKVAVIATS